MEHVACDLCEADDTAPAMRKDEWTLVRCRRCHLVYLDPRPEPEVIAHEFDWFRHAPLQVGERRSAESRLRSLFRASRGKGLLRRRPRQAVVRGRIQQFVESGRFLDVGCGDGFMVEVMADAGFDAYGLDISEVAVEECHRRGRTSVRKGTIHETVFEDGTFDAILLMSYLEHEPRPTAAMRRVFDLLKPGGHVFVKVPHYGSWNRVLLGARWCGYYFPQHLFHFTPSTIGRLLEKCGLEVVRNGFWDHVPFSDVLWATARRPN